MFAEDVPDERRTLILDLLANAGTPEAQNEMRRLLSLPLARRNSRTFATFIQRLGFVQRPDAATVQLLMTVYGESQYEAPDVRAACAYALGAAAGRAHVSGLVDSTLRVATLLRRDLDAAHDPAQKCALLTALSNAGLEADVPVLLRFLGDADPRVRAAAAVAIRKLDSADARAKLLSMLDRDATTAGGAISALLGQILSEEDILRIAKLVLGGCTAAGVDSRILQLIVAQNLDSLTTPGVVAEAIHVLLRRIDSHEQSRLGHPSGEQRKVHITPAPAPALVPAPPPTPTPTSAAELDSTIRDEKSPVSGALGALRLARTMFQRSAAPARIVEGKAFVSKAAFSICVDAQPLAPRRRSR